MSSFTKMFLWCLVAVAVTADWTAHNCFTCRDKDRCPNIVRIFGPDDSLLFEKDPKDKIQNCSGVPPVTKNCTVCLAKSDISIYCPNDIKTFEAETNGQQIISISKGCEEEQNTNPRLYGPTTGASQISANIGLILGGLLFILFG
ncbi:hypothetical protein ATANTOWER_012879 [Ataeniobius toweri]|uniref:Uncharacterized protein n=1 Tax=Ataeniobius toweri TaxID=208326 RepID=A0ABU7A619_9TELE|nr:hypothetical protein [Ataeniobius toweri]